MAPTRLPPIFSPVTENRLQIRMDARPLPLFDPGQVLEARVLQRLDGERLLIRIQDQSFVARTGIPLQAGENLHLRVEGLTPLLTLVLLERSGGESARTGEALRAVRSDPEALAKSLAAVLEAIDPENPAAPRGLSPGGDAARMLRLLRGLVLPNDTAGNPLWVRDCLHSLGFLLESDVRREVQKGFSAGMGERSVSLKELLLSLIERLRSPGVAGGKDVSQILSLFEGALRSIENLQILNVLLQDQEGRYLLQIPFWLSGRMTTADVFVYPDRENRGGKRGLEGHRVVLALRVDALGEIVVQAGWRGRRIDCRIECGDEETRDFIRPLLRGLADRLETLGFQTGEMICVAKKDLRQAREEFFQSQLPPLAAVDLFA